MSKLKYYDKIENLEQWAEAHGRKVNDLAHAWLLSQPKICSVISGVTKIEQIFENAKAGDWVLTDEELEEINSILGPVQKGAPALQVIYPN